MTEHLSGKRIPERLLGYILIFCIFLLAASFSLREITCYDFWFHLKAGQWIVETSKIPEYDPFSFTVPTHTYLDSHWLFQVVLYLTYRAGGIAGIQFLRLLIVGLMVIFLLKVANGKNYEISSLFIFSALVVVQKRLYPRPELASFFFISLYFLILHDYKYRDRDKTCLLPFLQVVWTNMHGLFIIGPVMVLCYLVGEMFSSRIMSRMKWYGDIPVTRRKYAKILIVFLLMILACFVNPYGIKGVSYPFLLFTQISSQAHESMKRVSELQPTLTMKHIEDVFFHYRFLGFLACLTFLLNIRKLNVTFIMLYTGFWAVSLKAWRNTALFALIAAPIAISNINNVSLKVKKFVDSRVILKHGCRVLISAVLIVFMIFWTVNGVTNKYYVKEGSIERFGTGVSKFAYPEGAVRFIEENNLEGNMFNDAAIGGYLIWRLSPERKIFVDGRWEVRYGDEFMNRIDQSCMDIESFNTLMDEYNVNYIILTHISRESVLILSDLYKDRKWALVYFDDVGSLFIRNTLQNRSIIENNKIDFSSEMKDFTGRVKGYQHNNFQKALFFVTVGLIDNARYEFRKAIAINARFFEAYYNLALSYGGVDWKEMRVLLEKAAVINAHFNGLHYNLAVACEKTGDNQNAIKEYEKEIKINPEDVSSYKNLGLIYYKRAEYEKTVPLWEKYLQLLPGASDAVLIKAELDKIREK